MTVTVKLAVADSPASLVAVQLTVVAAIANSAPDSGAQPTLTGLLMVSVAVAAG